MALEFGFNEYAKAIDLDGIEGDPKFKRFIHRISDNLPKKNIRALHQMIDFLEVQRMAPKSRHDFSMAVFEISSIGDETDADEEISAKYGYLIFDENLKRRYLSISPTYKSMDGEFKNDLFKFEWGDEYIAKFYKKFLDVFSNVERELLSLIGEMAISLNVYVFPEENSEEINEYVDTNRLAVKILVLAWMRDVLIRTPPLLPSHVSANYRRIMQTLSETTREVATKHQDKKDEMERMFRRWSKSMIKDVPELGIKLTPLSVNASMNPEDIEIDCWKEIYVNRLATDLVINFVAPCFPMYSDWAYVRDSSPEMFENHSMKELYRRSEKARRTISLLREARKSTQIDNVSHNLPDGGKFGRLEKHIYDAIEFTNSFLLMSGYTIMSFNQYVGNTFHNFLTWFNSLDSLPAFPERESVEAIFTSVDVFMGVVFSYVHGLHALHTRLGIIHSDLHVNNMTINRWMGSDVPDGSVSVYVSGPNGELDTYVFPSAGISGYIIDFSRSIIGNKLRGTMAKDFGEGPTLAYYRNQVNVILATINAYLPHLTENHQEKIKSLVYDNYDEFFKVVAGIDYLALFRNISAVIEDSPNVAQKIRLKMKNFKEAAEETVISGFMNIFKDRTKAVGFPGDILIPKLFEPYSYRSYDDAITKNFSIIEMHNINGELRYSSRAYETFPPFANADIIGKIAPKLEKSWFKKKDALDPDFDTFIERLKLEGDEPVNTESSSWI